MSDSQVHAQRCFLNALQIHISTLLRDSLAGLNRLEVRPRRWWVLCRGISDFSFEVGESGAAYIP